MEDEPEEVGGRLGAKGGGKGGAVAPRGGVGAEMLKRLSGWTAVRERAKGDIQDEAHGPNLTGKW